MSKFKTWVGAARLRTLPLSVSGIIVGTTIASINGHFDPYIFFLALLTTVGFQITSNFANDYGDGVKGTDNKDRVGPTRALQSGLLGRAELKKGIWISIVVNLLLVICLLYKAFLPVYPLYALLFTVLGLLSIWAAIRYTVGEQAYGYKGLGDLFVFLFFGLLSVLGSMFLYTKTLIFMAVFPAMGIGLLSTAVLNLNNLRDSNSDRNSGKNTLIVKIGYAKGRIYHYTLVALAFLCMLAFNLQYRSWAAYINLLAFIPIGFHLISVAKAESPAKLDPELKKLALSTFLLALLFYFGYYYFL